MVLPFSFSAITITDCNVVLANLIRRTTFQEEAERLVMSPMLFTTVPLEKVEIIK
jgi:hypothetical protein